MEDLLTEKKEHHEALISRLIKNGSAKAHYHLGLIFERGHGVEKNLERAIFYFEKAAYRSDVTAQYKLGMLYFSKQGDLEEERKALYWFEKASEQGHPEGNYYFNLLMDYGVRYKKEKRPGAYYQKRYKNINSTISYFK